MSSIRRRCPIDRRSCSVSAPSLEISEGRLRRVPRGSPTPQVSRDRRRHLERSSPACRALTAGQLRAELLVQISRTSAARSRGAPTGRRNAPGGSSSTTSARSAVQFLGRRRRPAIPRATQNVRRDRAADGHLLGCGGMWSGARDAGRGCGARDARPRAWCGDVSGVHSFCPVQAPRLIASPHPRPAPRKNECCFYRTRALVARWRDESPGGISAYGLESN